MRLKEIVDSIMPPILRRIRESDTENEVREAYRPAEGSELFYSGESYDRWGWRSISRSITDGDEIAPEEHRSILRRAYSAWCKNPLAGQIVNLTTWFVMGKGIGFRAKDDRVQSALMKFWRDPENDMQATQHWMSNELQIYGELFIRFFVNPINGAVRIALVDPMEIRDVVTDPDNVRKAVAYLREYRRRAVDDEWIEGFRNRDFGLTHGDEEVKEIIDAREIIHVKVNNVSNRTRGMSELYRILPWLDAYERWLQDRVVLNRAKGTFAFLRKIPVSPERAGGPVVRDSAGKVRIPKPGSILVVHEAEDWQVLSPGIGADDAKEDGRALKLMIAAGSGIFEHYLGDPSTGNLATTRSMELPMVRKFEDRQRLFETVFGRIFQRVIDAGIRSGVLPTDVDKTVEVNFPPIVPDDVETLTRTLVEQVNAGLISKDSARRMIPWIEDASSEAESVDEEKRGQ
ncbi:MAG TPA: phage portal protein [Firmicutes bacterium]|nr:phage portal protein [Bacillota bacterium]